MRGCVTAIQETRKQHEKANGQGIKYQPEESHQVRILETSPQEVNRAIDRLLGHSNRDTRLDVSEVEIHGSIRTNVSLWEKPTVGMNYLLTWRCTSPGSREGGEILITRDWERFSRVVAHVLALRRGELVLPLPALRELRKPARREYRRNIHLASAGRR